jgi:hypothetical protein
VHGAGVLEPGRVALLHGDEQAGALERLARVVAGEQQVEGRRRAVLERVPCALGQPRVDVAGELDELLLPCRKCCELVGGLLDVTTGLLVAERDGIELGTQACRLLAGGVELERPPDPRDRQRQRGHEHHQTHVRPVARAAATAGRNGARGLHEWRRRARRRGRTERDLKGARAAGRPDHSPPDRTVAVGHASRDSDAARDGPGSVRRCRRIERSVAGSREPRVWVDRATTARMHLEVHVGGRT